MHWCLMRFACMFSIYNHPIYFIFASNFKENLLGTHNVSRHIPSGLSSWMCFTTLSIVSIDISFAGAIFPVIWVYPTAYWHLYELSFNSWSICVYRLPLVCTYVLKISEYIEIIALPWSSIPSASLLHNWEPELLVMNVWVSEILEV